MAVLRAVFVFLFATSVAALNTTYSITHCPALCQCLNESHQDTGEPVFVIRCGGLTSIPNITGYSGKVIHHLYFQMNSISEIPDFAFKSWDAAILSIHLDQNPVVNISSYAFNGLERHLKHLSLRQTKLEVLPSTFLEGFAQLEILDLRDIRTGIFSETSENMFPSLPNLNILELNYNGIRSIHPHAFLNLSSLEYLSLEENLLQDVPMAVQKLQNLRELVLTLNNRLKVINASSLEGLNKLEILKLDYISRLTIDPESFQHCSDSLRELHLTWNDLQEVPQKIFKPLKKLRFLNLAYNRIASIQPLDFQELNGLTKLDLTGNMEIGLNGGADTFRGLEDSLEYLFLGFCELQELPVEPLSVLTNVNELHLSGNNFEGRVANVSKINVRNLFLDNCNINSIQSSAFNSMKSPMKLDLTGNPISNIDFISEPCLFERLTLKRIPVNCTCNLLSIANVEAINVDGTCQSPNVLNGMEIEDAATIINTTDCEFPEVQECAWADNRNNASDLTRYHIVLVMLNMIFTLIYVFVA